jgi:hypothetical protein
MPEQQNVVLVDAAMLCKAVEFDRILRIADSSRFKAVLPTKFPTVPAL